MKTACLRVSLVNCKAKLRDRGKETNWSPVHEAKQYPLHFLSCEPVNLSNVFLLRLSELGICHQKNFDRNHI